MNIEKLIVTLALVVLAAPSTQAQGTFQDFDFESANLSPIPSGQYGGEVPISSALPGWNASIGGVSVTQVLQNNYTGGATCVDLFGPNWTLLGPGIIGGNYTVYLQAFSSSQGNVSLWQNGTIPANAASLEFSAWSQYNPAYFLVSFAGNNLSPVMLSSGTAPSGQPYDVFGVNIAPYAGQTGQLQFTALDNNPPGNIELDDITFPTQPIPEPSPLALTGVGALLFALYRRLAAKWP